MRGYARKNFSSENWTSHFSYFLSIFIRIFNILRQIWRFAFLLPPRTLAKHHRRSETPPRPSTNTLSSSLSTGVPLLFSGRRKCVNFYSQCRSSFWLTVWVVLMVQRVYYPYFLLADVSWWHKTHIWDLWSVTHTSFKSCFKDEQSYVNFYSNKKWHRDNSDAKSTQ